MRINLLFLAILLFIVFQIQDAQSQDEKGTHTFKITGKTKVSVSPPSAELRTVEYDPISPDHLFISDFDVDGNLVTKTVFLFKGEKFNLTNLDKYINSNVLYRDGIHINYGEGLSVSSELIYKEGIVIQATTYYSNGNKQMFLSGDAEILNGEYKMWYSDGQLSYSGNYKNNLKDGLFESFDQAGNSTRKGIYEAGKLISGKSVVQDLLYEEPDVPAEFIGGDAAFNEYLKAKTANLKEVKKMKEEDLIPIGLRLTIDYFGQINMLEFDGSDAPGVHEMIDLAFKNFPDFKPALVEDAPVSSILKLNLLLSKNGLQKYISAGNYENLTESEIYASDNDTIAGITHLTIEEMPEFPEGQLGLRTFIAQNIRYPVYAQENGIQGKVFVSFIIREDGSISGIKIAKSVHPTLDLEAVRLIRLLPKWSPGRINGKAVRVKYTVPINFVLG